MNDHPLHILEWLAEMGDDIPLSEQSIDRFAESEAAMAELLERSKASRPQTRGVGAMPQASLKDRAAALNKGDLHSGSGRNDAVLPDESVVAQAREIAGAASTIEALKIAIEAFEGCNLRPNAKNTVFASGNPLVDLMLIDEHPGRDEDIQGEPFAARSGVLLEKMLAAINIKPDDVYRVAALPWHSPGNRPPTPAEIAICKPFLERHIELAAPKLVIIMGNTGARMLLDANAPLLTIRGKWNTVDIGVRKFECLATLNPAFLLSQPAQKRLAWQDLLKIKAKLGESR